MRCEGGNHLPNDRYTANPIAARIGHLLSWIPPSRAESAPPIQRSIAKTSAVVWIFSTVASVAKATRVAAQARTMLDRAASTNAVSRRDGVSTPHMRMSSATILSPSLTKESYYARAVPAICGDAESFARAARKGQIIAFGQIRLDI